jgi:hypothetical protein
LSSRGVRVLEWNADGWISESGHTMDSIVKFGGGNLMVWGCMRWNGVGIVCEVEGSMNAEQYVSILEECLLRSMEESDVDEEDITFQQDNDLKHTSKLATKWFEDHDINVLS